MQNKKQTLKYKFDVSTFRLLGRELITDRVTALFELVKNCYDANATTVTIDFLNVNSTSKDSKIIISDNGIGMTLQDIKNKWMVIGTSSKRRNETSPPPLNRKVVGKKGIGRFAVDKLGSELLLQTKKQGSNEKYFLHIDWTTYEKEAVVQLKFDLFNENQKYFTDIENEYWTEKSNSKESGTTLEISLINDTWTENDISRLHKELSKLVSPYDKSNNFSIFINSNEYETFRNKKVESITVDFAKYKFVLNYNEEKNTQEVLQYYKKEHNLKTTSVPKREMGFVKFTFYYFDEKGKKQFKKHTGDGVDGIKIYRDGIITTPFAEYEPKRDRRKDILGIDKRRWSDLYKKKSTRDLLGFVEITKSRNPKIDDATNRQDFIDNSEYKELKKYILENIEAFEDFLEQEKKIEKDTIKSSFKNAEEDLTDVTTVLSNITLKIDEEKEQFPLAKEKFSELKKNLDDVKKQITKAKTDVKKGKQDYNKLEKEKEQQENIFFSLMSLQDYASEIAHVVNFSLDRVIADARFFKEDFPNPSRNTDFKISATNIFKEMKALRQAVKFMLSYAKSNTEFEQLNVKLLIEELFNRIHKERFVKEKIKTIVEINKSLLITHNKRFFEDIIDNLISNSIKALKNTENKIIKCSGVVENDKFVIHFSDNGCGIDEADKLRIFNIYFTNTAEQGGAGIGLFVVKTRIEALKGSVEVVKSEFKTGATFKITLPFNK